MASWNFRRRVTLMPGVRINLSKQGFSTTFGPRGANVNIGRQGAFLNTGLPGTGIYKRQKIGASTRNPPMRRHNPASAEVHDDQSYDAYEFEAIGSPELSEVEKAINITVSEREKLQSDIKKSKRRIQTFRHLRILLFVVYFYFNRKVKEEESLLEQLEQAFQEAVIDMDIDLNPEVEGAFKKMKEAFSSMAQSTAIWDITRETQAPDRRLTRSAATTSIERTLTSIHTRDLPFIKCKYDALFIKNEKQFDLYFYPAFLIIDSRDHYYAVLSYNDLNIDFKSINFHETGDLPADTKVLKHVWHRANKDGSPDRRFKHNFQIPVCLYGQLRFESTGGFEETYMFSREDVVKNFTDTFLAYKSLLQRTKGDMSDL